MEKQLTLKKVTLFVLSALLLVLMAISVAFSAGTRAFAADSGAGSSSEGTDHSGHDVGDLVTVKPATCVEPGVGTYYCNTCGRSFNVVIPADSTKHDPVKQGDGHYKCSICGKEDASVTLVPAESEKNDDQNIYVQAVESSDAITDLNIPATVEHEGTEKKVHLAEEAFKETKLESVTIDSAVDIGENAFEGCKNLAEVKIVKNEKDEITTYVAADAFDNTPFYTKKLKKDEESGTSSLAIPVVNAEGKEVGTYLLKVELSTSGTPTPSPRAHRRDAAAEAAEITSFTVPKDTLVIASGAFSELTDLTTVTLNAELHTVCAGAFAGTKLANVIVAAGVKDNSFVSVDGLTDLGLNTIYYKGTFAENLKDIFGKLFELIRYYSATEPDDAAHPYWHFSGEGETGLPVAWSRATKLFIDASACNRFKLHEDFHYNGLLVYVTYEDGTSRLAGESEYSVDPTKYQKDIQTDASSDYVITVTYKYISGTYTVRVANAYRITIDYNDGTTESGEALVYAGDPYTIPATAPTYAGHKFLGWKYGEETTLKNPGDKINDVEADVTLQAQWETLYTVSVTGDHVTAQIQGTPTDDGVEGTQTYYAKGAQITFTLTVANGYKLTAESVKFGETTLTAGEGGTYSVTVGEENVEVTVNVAPVEIKTEVKEATGVEPQVQQDGATATLTIGNPTKDGYRFDGWDVTVDGEAKTYNNGLTLDLANADVTVTFTAKWTQLYTVTVTGTNIKDVLISGKNYTVGQSDATKYYEADTVVTISFGTNNGYKFKAIQNATATADGKYTVTVGENTAVNHVVTVTIETEEVAVNVRFFDDTTPLEGMGSNVQRTDGGAKAVVTVSGTPAKDGYRFTGWTVKVGENVITADESGAYTIDLASTDVDVNVSANWYEIPIEYTVNSVALTLTDGNLIFTVQITITNNRPYKNATLTIGDDVITADSYANSKITFKQLASAEWSSGEIQLSVNDVPATLTDVTAEGFVTSGASIIELFGDETGIKLNVTTADVFFDFSSIDATGETLSADSAYDFFKEMGGTTEDLLAASIFGTINQGNASGGGYSNQGGMIRIGGDGATASITLVMNDFVSKVIIVAQNWHKDGVTSADLSVNYSDTRSVSPDQKELYIYDRTLESNSIIITSEKERVFIFGIYVIYADAADVTVDEKFTMALDQLVITNTLLTENLTLPTVNIPGVQVTWTIENGEDVAVLSADQSEVQITAGEKDVPFKLKATVSVDGAQSQEKTFDLTVKHQITGDVVFDFTGFGETYKSVTYTELQSACGNADEFTGVTAANNLAPGNDGTTGNYIGNDCIKFGSSKNKGELTLTFSKNVVSVVVLYQSWGATEGTKLNVNGKVGEIVPANDPQYLEYDLSDDPSTSVAIAGNVQKSRGFIFKLYITFEVITPETVLSNALNKIKNIEVRTTGIVPMTKSDGDVTFKWVLKNSGELKAEIGTFENDELNIKVIPTDKNLVLNFEVTATLGEETASKEVTVTVIKGINPGTKLQPLTVAEAIELAGEIDGNGYLGGTTNPTIVYVKGYVIKIDGWDSGYSDWTKVFIADTVDEDSADKTKAVQVFRLELDGTYLTKQADLILGAQITVCGCLQKYNEQIEVSYNPATKANVKAVAYTKPDHEHVWSDYSYTSGLQHTKVCNVPGCEFGGESQTEACTPDNNQCPLCQHIATQAEILAAYKALQSGQSLPGTYSLSGTVVTGSAAPKKGSSGDWQFYFQVDDVTIYVFYASLSEPVAPAGTELKVGDKVTVLGEILSHQGTKEYNKDSAITAWSPASPDPTPGPGGETEESVKLATFSMGTDGGNSAAGGNSYSASKPIKSDDGRYTLNITNSSNLYTDVYDSSSSNHACIRVGTSKGTNSYIEFSVPPEVKKVVIYIAKYSGDALESVTINNQTINITHASDSGIYDQFDVDTSTNKTVKVLTAKKRIMINTIEFWSGIPTEGGGDTGGGSDPDPTPGGGDSEEILQDEISINPWSGIESPGSRPNGALASIISKKGFTFEADKTNQGQSDPAISNNQWRLYASNTLTITAPSGMTIVTVAVTYTSGSNGKLQNSTQTTTYASEAPISVNNTSVTFRATSSGQVRITKIVIEYKAVSSDVGMEMPSATDLVANVNSEIPSSGSLWLYVLGGSALLVSVISLSALAFVLIRKKHN